MRRVDVLVWREVTHDEGRVAATLYFCRPVPMCGVSSHFEVHGEQPSLPEATGLGDPKEDDSR
jgi:hypothetical protein